MKKLLIILGSLLLIGCEGKNENTVNPPQQNKNSNQIYLEHSTGITNTTELSIIKDTKNGVTCYVITGYHYYAGSGIFCFKDEKISKE